MMSTLFDSCYGYIPSSPSSCFNVSTINVSLAWERSHVDRFCCPLRRCSRPLQIDADVLLKVTLQLLNRPAKNSIVEIRECCENDLRRIAVEKLLPAGNNIDFAEYLSRKVSTRQFHHFLALGIRLSRFSTCVRSLTTSHDDEDYN